MFTAVFTAVFAAVFAAVFTVFTAVYTAVFTAVFTSDHFEITAVIFYITALSNIVRDSTRLAEVSQMLLPPYQSLKLATQLEGLSPQWLRRGAHVLNSAATNVVLLLQ